MAQATSHDEHAAALTKMMLDFIVAMFGRNTTQPVFFQTLANDKGDPDESRIKTQLLTRNPDRLSAFVAKHNRNRRGMFYCTSTLAEGASTRNKELVRETSFLFADLDFKTLSEQGATIYGVIAGLKLLPSIIVRSGGGLHVYWLFREAIDTQAEMERIETALRRLSWLLGGDPSVCEVSRLMRLPGTTNSKYGDQREVVCEVLEGDRRYDLAELEAWLDSEPAPLLTYLPPPVVTRASGGTLREPALPENPFVAFGRAYGFRPALDVEEALNAMAIGNVHNTQRSVTASLIKAGHDLGEVVELMLNATKQAVGDAGARWNWRTEERKIRDMSVSAQVKYPPKDEPKEIEEKLNDPSGVDGADDVSRETVSTTGSEAGSDDGATVADDATKPENPDDSATEAEKPDDLAAAATAEPPKPGPKVVDLDSARKGSGGVKRKPKAVNSTHIALAKAVVSVLRQRGFDLMFTNNGIWRYADGTWRLETDRGMNAWLNSLIEEGAQGLSIETTNKLINEARGYIVRDPELQRIDVRFNQHGMVPTMSGLLDIGSGEIVVTTPEHYCTWNVPFKYDAAAQCPNWLLMLEEVFSDRSVEVRAAHIQIIQELLGLGLIDLKNKATSRALVLVGGSDFGKSSLLDVMGGLFGPHYNSTPITTIESNAHGTMPFLDRWPWILHEAFNAGKWHLSDLIKALISGDGIQINFKGGGLITCRFTAPAFWGANSSPNFKEATDAIINRLVVIECRRKFDAAHPVGAAVTARDKGYEKPQSLVLAEEMEGVLAWAVEGLKRVKARGYLVLPEDSRVAAENIRIDANVVAGFMRDCVEFDPVNMISTPDFCASFASWWLENKGEGHGIPRAERIGWGIKALNEPRIAYDREETRLKSKRYYAGIRLNVEGLRHFKNTVDSNAFQFQGRTSNCSDTTEAVNRLIPDSWDSSAAIQAMRIAHEKAPK